jgi:hypothetical protein
VPEADQAVLTPSINAPLTHVEEHRGVERAFQSPGVAEEREARRALRIQIARLERALADAFVSAFPTPTLALEVSVPAAGGPRVLTLGELESLRDALIERLAQARATLAEHHDAQARNRELLEQVRLEPGRYKYFRIASADLGEGGCGEWHVRPRLGLVGMLAGWWQVKLSSGCPLARGPRPPGEAPTPA